MRPAVRASGQPCEIRLGPMQDGFVLFTYSTAKMGTRRAALDHENLAYAVEEPDPAPVPGPPVGLNT